MEHYILEPEASKLIESMRDIGYSLETALADILDNSISAGASKIEIFSRSSGEQPVIAVLDDGEGMTRNELLQAMRPGSRNPILDNRPHDLGRFGLGLKTASFSQGRRLTVVTTRSAQTTCAIWDLDHVASANKWEVLLPESAATVPFVEHLAGDGTLIVWEKLDRVSSTGDRTGASIGVALDEAREHLELVFHRFLAGERGQKKLSMKLNGRPLRPFDPFHSVHPATQCEPPEPEVMRLRGHDVLIQAFTLPHHRKVSQADWEKYAGKAGYTKNQGFYVYRERRLIIHGTWFGLARQTEATKLSRVRIDTPRELDQHWKIDVKKASAQLPPELRDHLRSLVERIGATSKRVYTYRGRIITDDKRLPVWNRVQQAGEIRYRLNLEHPVLAQLIEDVAPSMAERIRDALELAAAALPIDALVVDLSGKPEEVSGAEISAEALRNVAITTYRQLSSATEAPEKRIIDMMSVIDPFRTRFQQVREMLADEFGWVDA
ncbi:ATP-binding protein [Bosea sp. BK604]|uniref:ATP-binding protein n=1 Tax=Bosea sp. BK604 TaxID=2512180 RepID=UPI0020C05CDF|nr:ATP-binding protein [Bosea sp. BK604]